MMYSYSLTLAAGKTEKEASSVVMKLPPGRITKVRFDFPDGCEGLVHVRVLKADSFVFPTNPSGTIYGDHFPIEGPAAYDLYPGETRLKFLGWNTDDTFPHKVSVTLWIEKPEPSEERLLLQRIVEYLTLFGERF